MNQLRKLATPFPAQFINTVQKAGRQESYVSHSVITQALLAVVGPFTLQVRDVTITGTGPDERVDLVVSITCTIDGEQVTLESTGTDHATVTKTGNVIPASAQNAEAQAFKRAVSRAGLGLHLWAGTEYFLHDRLKGEPDEMPV